MTYLMPINPVKTVRFAAQNPIDLTSLTKEGFERLAEVSRIEVYKKMRVIQSEFQKFVNSLSDKAQFDVQAQFMMFPQDSNKLCLPVLVKRPEAKEIFKQLLDKKIIHQPAQKGGYFYKGFRIVLTEDKELDGVPFSQQISNKDWHAE